MVKFRPHSNEQAGKCFFPCFFLSPLGLLRCPSCLTQRCRFARSFAGFRVSINKDSRGDLPGVSEGTRIIFEGSEMPESRLPRTAVIPDIGVFKDTMQACVLGFSREPGGTGPAPWKPILGFNIRNGGGDGKTMTAFKFEIDLPVFVHRTERYFDKLTPSGHDLAAVIPKSISEFTLKQAGIPVFPRLSST